MLSRAGIDSILAALPQLRLGLVGDLFLDRYLELVPGVVELSIETGLEAYQIERVRNAPGALGTVMNNLAALGVGKLVPVTVLGNDGHGFDLRQELHKLPADLSRVVVDPRRLTPTYTKPLRRDEAGVWCELNRLDVRSREPLHDQTLEQLIEHIQQVANEVDGWIVLDQVNERDWGVVHSSVRDALADLHRRRPEQLMFVDSRQHLQDFSCGILKGNRSELLAAAPEAVRSSAEVPAILEGVVSRTGEPVYCTVGEEGIWVAGPGTVPERIPTYPVRGPVDIVGAGDAASSGIVTALLAGCSIWEAAAFGNLVASVTVQQLGTTGTASPVQVRARWEEVMAG